MLFLLKISEEDMVQLRAPKTIRNSHSKENPKNPSEQDKTNLKLNKDLDNN